MSEVEKMYRNIESFSDETLKTIWRCLRHYDPQSEYAPGISMDTWAETIYSEMDKRGISHKDDEEGELECEKEEQPKENEENEL